MNLLVAMTINLFVAMWERISYLFNPRDCPAGTGWASREEYQNYDNSSA